MSGLVDPLFISQNRNKHTHTHMHIHPPTQPTHTLVLVCQKCIEFIKTDGENAEGWLVKYR